MAPVYADDICYNGQPPEDALHQGYVECYMCGAPMRVENEYDACYDCQNPEDPNKDITNDGIGEGVTMGNGDW